MRSDIEIAGILYPVLESLRKRLGEDLVSLVLFGSQARGEADEDSDWDLLLIGHNLPDGTIDRSFMLQQLLPSEWRSRISLLGKTPIEFERRLPALYLDIALDGIVLHDTDDYVAEKLARLKRSIQDHGLERKQSGRDLIWKWKVPPAGRWSLEWGVTPETDAAYRLRLARGFLDEATQDVALGRWRSAVGNSQLAVENSVKALLSLLGPVGRTHAPSAQLRKAISEGVFPESLIDSARQLFETAETLKPDVHIQTDYGDELGGRTPWEIFRESDGRETLSIAQRTVSLATRIVEEWRSRNS